MDDDTEISGCDLDAFLAALEHGAFVAEYERIIRDGYARLHATPSPPLDSSE